MASWSICHNCSHATYLHYDERGCHSENCRCMEYYEPPTNPTKLGFRGYNKKIEERKPPTSDFLKELWDEIILWHGDVLKR